MNNKITNVFILGISMIISSFFIASAIDKIYVPNNSYVGDVIANSIYSLNDVEPANNEVDHRGTVYFYKTDLAEYLGISEDDLNELLEQEEFDIPYIKINLQYIFYKDAVDQWLLNKRATFSVGDF